jgi:hypothetical protein
MTPNIRSITYNLALAGLYPSPTMLYMAEKLITQTMETTNLSIQKYTSGPMVSLDAEILHALAQATCPPVRL